MSESSEPASIIRQGAPADADRIIRQIQRQPAGIQVHNKAKPDPQVVPTDTPATL